MARHNTRKGPAADIGSAATYSNQYYYGTDTGLYYYSDGSTWTIKTFDDARSVVNKSDTIATKDTAKLIIPANTDRRWLLVQNVTNADMYIGIGYPPVKISNGVYTGVKIASAGGLIRFDTFVPTDAIYGMCAADGHVFTCLEG